MRKLAMALSVLSFVVGCSGDQGKVGSDGGQGDLGPVGPVGPAGPAGSIVSTRAYLGLQIAPVALDLVGLSSAQVEQVGQGSYLVNAASDCVGCHMGPAPTFAYLAGGSPFPLSLPPGTEFAFAPNLTPDGQSGLHRSEDEFVELMRTGRDFVNNGDSLRHHTWSTFRWISTADLKAIYAYLQRIPSVSNQLNRSKSAFTIYTAAAPVPFPAAYNEGATDRALPADDASDRDNVLRGLAIQPDPIAENQFELLSPEEQKLYGRGSYLVNATGVCGDCHNNGASGARGAVNPWFDTSRDDDHKLYVDGNMSGGRLFAKLVPGIARSMAANLIGGGNGLLSDPSYTFTDFLTAMNSGMHERANGVKVPLAPPMPWSSIRNLESDDLLAIYVYLVNAPRAVIDPVTQSMALECAGNPDCAVGTCDTVNGECTGMSCTTDADCPACQSCGDGDPIADGVCGMDPAVYNACAVFGL